MLPSSPGDDLSLEKVPLDVVGWEEMGKEPRGRAQILPCFQGFVLTLSPETSLEAFWVFPLLSVLSLQVGG